MTDRDRLTQLLRGERNGFTREQLVRRLGMSDRAVRKLIEEAVAESDWPIICDRTGGTEGHYRIAQAHEHDLVNRECAEDHARAMSSHVKAKGRRLAFERRYQAGSLFLNDVPEMPA